MYNYIIHISVGIEFRDGILAAFEEINSMGGVWGSKKLRLISFDDAYDPANTIINTNFFLYNMTPPNTSLNYATYFQNSSGLQQPNVSALRFFGLIGYVGTPTVQAVYSDILSTQVPLIGSLTGVGWLRSPFYPNVINVRASYDDETAAMIDWLVNVKLIRKISIMYQNDAFGLAGLSGVNRILVNSLNIPITSLGTYTRNTLDVESAFYSIRFQD